MRPAAAVVLAGCATAIAGVHAAAQSAPPAPGRVILSVNFTGLSAGQLPPSITRVIRGNLQVVNHGGVDVLRADEPSEFVLNLPEALPRDFTIEFEVIPKRCCNPDLTFEGGASINQSNASAHVLWDGDGAIEVIGGGDRFSMQLPASLSLPNAMNHVAMIMHDDGTLRLYTNGQRNFTLADRRFIRSRNLRVFLGGQRSDQQPVYLARITVTEGAPTGSVIAQRASVVTGTAVNSSAPPAVPTGVTGVVATVDAQGVGSIMWQAVTGATSYFVVRWLDGDPVCCANMSSPQGSTSLNWQDGVLPRAGSYTYRVYATTPSAIVTGEAKVQFQGIASGVPHSGTRLNLPNATRAPVLPASREITLATLAGTGARVVPPASQNINLAAINAVGPVVMVNAPTGATRGLPGTSGGPTVPATRTITLPGVTALGGFVLPLSRTITLPGWTGVGPG